VLCLPRSICSSWLWDACAWAPRHRQAGARPTRCFVEPVAQRSCTRLVISFAMTALLLVVLLAARGSTGTDHVDGREPEA